MESPNFQIVQNCFNNSWRIYQEIIRCNYMKHQEIYAALRNYLTNHYAYPFSLLELGCGDALYSAKTLKETAISSYVGVDLSETGLTLARQNLNELNCSVELKQLEMWEFLEGCSSTFDLILISFALHHLSSSQKQALLKKCYHHLNSGGALLLIDIFCREFESRSKYLTRYCDYIESQWEKISSCDRTVVNEHMTASDFPESVATFRRWGSLIGFNQVELIYQGTLKIHNAMAFCKPIKP